MSQKPLKLYLFCKASVQIRDELIDVATASSKPPLTAIHRSLNKLHAIRRGILFVGYCVTSAENFQIGNRKKKEHYM